MSAVGGRMGRLTAGYFTLMGQAIDALAQIVASVFVARTLGPIAHGDVVFGLGFAALVSVWVLFGTSDPALRMYVDEPSRQPAVLRAHLRTWLRGSAQVMLLALVIAAAMWPRSATVSLVVVVATVTLVVNALSSVFNVVLMARGDTRADAAVLFASRAALLASVVAATHRGPVAVMISYLFAALILAVGRAAKIHRLLAECRLVGIDDELSARLSREGRSVGVGATFGSIASKIDTVFLQSAAAPGELGLYGACYRLIGALQTVAVGFAIAFFPRAVREQSANPRRALLRFALPGFMLLGFSAVMLLMTRSILLHLYGPAFVSAVPMMNLLLIACMLQIVSIFLHKILVLLGAQRSLPWAQGMQAIANVGLNVILVPRHGAMGAAIATLVCEAVVICGHLAFHRAKFRPAFTATMRLSLATK